MRWRIVEGLKVNHLDTVSNKDFALDAVLVEHRVEVVWRIGRRATTRYGSQTSRDGKERNGDGDDLEALDRLEWSSDLHERFRVFARIGWIAELVQAGKVGTGVAFVRDVECK